MSSKFLAAAWESWIGAAFRAGTGISSEQTDEEDQKTGKWYNFEAAHLGAGNSLSSELYKSCFLLPFISFHSHTASGKDCYFKGGKALQ